MIQWKRLLCGLVLAMATFSVNAQSSEAIVKAAARVWDYEQSVADFGARCMKHMPEKKLQIQQLAQQWQRRNRDILIKAHAVMAEVKTREPELFAILKQGSQENIRKHDKINTTDFCPGFVLGQERGSIDVDDMLLEAYQLLTRQN